MGIQPYPDRSYPRVVGIATSVEKSGSRPLLVKYVKGDATEPRGAGTKIIAHVVNDKAMLWGAGFALAVRKKWEGVQRDFQIWATEHRDQFALGNIKLGKAEAEVLVCHMLSQHGYGASKTPRIRYSALRSCLEKLAQAAQEIDASI